MKQVIINDGQCLLDIATQHLGNASDAFEIALANGFSLTDDLEIGNSVTVGEVAIENKKMIEGFADKKIIPASAENNLENVEGVDYWIIEDDFVVQ